MIGFEEIDFCKDDLYTTRKMYAEVYQYHPVDVEIDIFLCRAWKIDSICDENFLTNKDKDRIQTRIGVSEKECNSARQSKNTRYGTLSPTPEGTWRTSDKPQYDCEYAKDEDKVTWVFEMTPYKAVVRKYDTILHQSITETRCQWNRHACIPQRDKRAQIVWSDIPKLPEPYQ